MLTPTVETLAGDYIAWARVYYRRVDGSSTGHVLNLAHALRPLLRRYGDVSLGDIRAHDVRLLQGDMIAAGLCRTTVNARMRHLRSFVRWAVGRDRADSALVGRWAAVEWLKPGRSPAPEPPPVRPVALGCVTATLPHLPPSVASAVWVQWWTGMRVAEVCALHRANLTAGPGGVLVYRPARHKTAHHGHERAIVLGPNAVRHLDPARRTWLFPSSLSRPYSPRSYRQAIVRGCARASIVPWTPLQLRHAAATRVRAEAGIDAARLLLGHRSIATTERYAEHDLAELVEIARRVA